MARPRNITDDERAEIIATLRTTDNVRETARITGRGTSTVSRIAKAEGLEVSARSQTERATQARQMDNAARRAVIVAGMLEAAEKMLGNLFAKAEYVSVTKDGDVVRYSTEAPTFADQRNIAVSVKVLADGASSLEKIDQQTGDDAGRSLLEQLVAGLGAMAKGNP